MPSRFRLDKKRILVTGASSGLGRAVAVAASAQGATLIASGRDEARLAETLGLLGDSAPHAVIAADLTVDDDIVRLAKSTGAIDGVVHCAGIAGPIPLRAVSRQFLDERFDSNYFAPVLLTKHLLINGLVNSSGSILFLSSIAAHTGTHGMSVYSATKAALVVTAKCLALEVAKRKIRVNCLSPAVVVTPIFSILDSDWLEKTAVRYPLGLGKPEDVANAATFFLSDASRWITGQTLIMDGACPWI